MSAKRKNIKISSLSLNYISEGHDRTVSIHYGRISPFCFDCYPVVSMGLYLGGLWD